MLSPLRLRGVCHREDAKMGREPAAPQGLAGGRRVSRGQSEEQALPGFTFQVNRICGVQLTDTEKHSRL